MRLILSLSLTFFAVTGCVSSTGDSSSVAKKAPEKIYTSRKSARKQIKDLNLGLTDAALKNGKSVQVSGRTFKVGLIQNGAYKTVPVDDSGKRFKLEQSGTPYAIVTLIEPAGASYTGRDIATAGKLASGCNATFGAGVLAVLSGFSTNSTDLSTIPAPVRNGWRANLEC